MIPQNRATIAEIMQRAEEKLVAAKVLLKNRLWSDASSRAYYASFHAISAVLLSIGLRFKSHGQVIGGFNKHFVQKGIFPPEYGKRLTKIFRDRESGDSRANTEIADQIASEDFQFADEIVQACKGYLKTG